MASGDFAIAALWLAVIASGLYHGLNPGMGWPLAVSAGLMERRGQAVWSALAWLALGHLAAMLVAIVPFALLAVLALWQREIRLAAGLLVAALGLVQLVRRRHPRVLARIRPTQLGLWSFAVATAHGAALMLVPVYLGICRASETDSGHLAAQKLMATGLGTALAVSLAHTLAMLVAGGLVAWLVYRYLGLKVLSRTWLNLDSVWASSLVLVGALSLLTALAAD